MPSGDAEIVRRIHTAWSSGAAREALDLLHPDIVWVNPPDAVEPGTHTGIDRFKDALASVSDTFDQPVFEIEELREVGDHVVAIGVLRGQGQSSGIEIERRQGYVWTIREGRAVRFAWFNDPEPALEEAARLDAEREER